MDYWVTRQRPWDAFPAEEVVEVARGRDGFSAGATWVSDEFESAEDAVEVAINLADALGVPLTLAISDLVVPDAIDPNDLRMWASRQENSKPRCSRCGEKYDPDDEWVVTELEEEYFCSSDCSADAYEEWAYEVSK